MKQSTNGKDTKTRPPSFQVSVPSDSDSGDTNISPPAKKPKIADFDTILRRNTAAEKYDEAGKMDEHWPDEKVINDCIHGTVGLPPAAVAIVDTPEFQRLRKIKQTGSCSYVYPNATHNRFQHSIGVGHLARRFAEKLQTKYRAYISDKDVLCVMIAGLCHDLGHGPYSHLWENFMKKARKDAKPYHHEDTSITMFDKLLDDNNLRPKLKTLAKLDETDFIFIKELIAGPLDDTFTKPDPSKSPDDEPWPYKGRPLDKGFLYEIVANKISGIDVDKWDYFLRDDYYLNIGHVFDYARFMSFCKVKKEEIDPVTKSYRRRICLRLKEAENLKNMYEDRARLHKNGYQHRITKIVDKMLVEAWLLADKSIKIAGSDGVQLALSEASFDLEAHMKLNDEYVEYKIMETDPSGLNPEEAADLRAAQEIFRRINRRDLWRHVSSLDLDSDKFKALKQSVYTDEKILTSIQAILPANGPILPDDLAVVRRNVHLGFDMEKTRFYFWDKSSDVDIIKTHANTLLIEDRGNLRSQTVFILCKKSEKEAVMAAKTAVDQWLSETI